VVGYLAAVFIKPGGDGKTGAEEKEKSRVGVNLGLTDEEKEVLRTVVRKTLPAVVKTGQIPPIEGEYKGKLGEKWGAFVTLTKKGDLRGCIGNIFGTKPLIVTVAEMTRAAAIEDPRFRPVRPEELPDIDFEISVLTPTRRVKDIREIVVGRDGIIITQGYNRGLLLPQVATEYGWDLETFLEQTCQKARLPKDAWKDRNTIIEAFSAEVFH
jgi:AmmeMemoRadiSam system protein A